MTVKLTRDQRRWLRENRKRHVGTCSCGRWFAVGSRHEVDDDSKWHDSAGGDPDNHIVRIVRKRFGGRP